MMEHTTDRLFWTLTSIIVGALILTIGVNAFPKATQGVIQPISGVIKQADTTTHTADNAANSAISDNSGTANNNSSNNSSQNSSLPVSTPTDPDAQAKANAVNIDNNPNISIQNNNDGTATVTNFQLSATDSNNVFNGNQTTDLTYAIPQYVKSKNQILKITSLGNNALANIFNFATQGANSSGAVGQMNGYVPTVNIKIPNSIATWNPNALGNTAIVAPAMCKINFQMSNDELNTLVPNGTTLLNQSNPNNNQLISQFPTGLSINGINNGFTTNIGFGY